MFRKTALPAISLFVLFCFGMTAVSIFTSAPTPTSAGGGPIFVDGDSNLLANIELRLLCYSSPSGTPFADFTAVTDDSGSVVLPAGCNYVAALWQQAEVPSGHPDHGPAFWVYQTSWPASAPAPSPSDGTIEIKEEFSLVLFNVVASLGWEEAAGAGQADELREGLRKASNFLFDVSEGRAAFGPVTIHDNGRYWDSADIRLLSANDYRPSAFVGGVVSDTVEYIGPTTLHYNPANIFLGRQWDGLVAHNGPWDMSDGYTTIIHEWAHHALFLYDEYIQTTGIETYCVCETLPSGCSDASIMSYHYTTSEFWQKDTHNLPPNCTSTQQYDVYGLSDWQTLPLWHDIQGLTFSSTTFVPFWEPFPPLTSSVNPGVVAHLFGRSPGSAIYLPSVFNPAGGASPPVVNNADVTVFLNDPDVLAGTLAHEVYLLEESDGTFPARIMHQGQLLGDPSPPNGLLGDIEFLGVGENDRMFIQASQYITDTITYGRYTYPHPDEPSNLVPDDGVEVELLPNNWQVSINFDQELTDGRFTKLIANVSSPSHILDANAVARLCVPDAEIGCHSNWLQPLISVPTPGGSSLWQATFEPLPGADELPLYGVIQISDPFLGDVPTWYQSAGGVGPAHVDVDAPLRDWHVMVDSEMDTGAPQDCNHVLVTPARDVAAQTTSLGVDGQSVPIAGLVTPPLDIDIKMPFNGTCLTGSGFDNSLPIPVYITLFYNQDVIDRLGIPETNLRILKFSRDNPTWSEAFNNGQDTTMNWMSTVGVMQDGIYAIGYVP